MRGGSAAARQPTVRTVPTRLSVVVSQWVMVRLRVAGRDPSPELPSAIIPRQSAERFTRVGLPGKGGNTKPPAWVFPLVESRQPVPGGPYHEDHVLDGTRAEPGPVREGRTTRRLD